MQSPIFVEVFNMHHECHIVLEHWIRVEIYVESSKLRQDDPFSDVLFLLCCEKEKGGGGL